MQPKIIFYTLFLLCSAGLLAAAIATTSLFYYELTLESQTVKFELGFFEACVSITGDHSYTKCQYMNPDNSTSKNSYQEKILIYLARGTSVSAGLFIIAGVVSTVVFLIGLGSNTAYIPQLSALLASIFIAASGGSVIWISKLYEDDVANLVITHYDFGFILLIISGCFSLIASCTVSFSRKSSTVVYSINQRSSNLTPLNTMAYHRVYDTDDDDSHA